MKEIKNIDNPLGIEMTREQLYHGVYLTTLPYGFYFESCGTNYGNAIYTMEIPTNHYVVKKVKNETDIDKNSK